MLNAANISISPTASSPFIAATSSKSANPWPSLLVGVLETALARYLALDSDSTRLVAPLDGKTIALVLEPFEWTLYLCPGGGTVQLLPECLGTVDVTLRGSPWAFTRLSLSDDPRQALFGGGVTVTGDMDVAKRLQTLFTRLDIDWEEHLSQLTGDFAANSLGRALRSGRDWWRETRRTFRLNLAEYLQEESRDLPAVSETEFFCAEVDRLRADADRLEARIARLKAHCGG
ncbi:MAG: sterol-binding protein [Methylococcaceae bacterium]|nr:MAG: sterol-binding protein [Methylococcaceae bacterium]